MAIKITGRIRCQVMTILSYNVEMHILSKNPKQMRRRRKGGMFRVTVFVFPSNRYA